MSSSAAFQHSFRLQDGRGFRISGQLIELGENKENLNAEEIAMMHAIIAQAQLMAQDLSGDSLLAVHSLLKSVRTMISKGATSPGVLMTKEQKAEQVSTLKTAAMQMRNDIQSVQALTAGKPQLRALMSSSLKLISKIAPAKKSNVIRLAVVRAARAGDVAQKATVVAKSSPTTAAVKANAKPAAKGPATVTALRSDTKIVAVRANVAAPAAVQPRAEQRAARPSATVLNFSEAKAATATLSVAPITARSTITPAIALQVVLRQNIAPVNPLPSNPTPVVGGPDRSLPPSPVCGVGPRSSPPNPDRLPSPPPNPVGGHGPDSPPPDPTDKNPGIDPKDPEPIEIEDKQPIDPIVEPPPTNPDPEPEPELKPSVTTQFTSACDECLTKNCKECGIVGAVIENLDDDVGNFLADEPVLQTQKIQLHPAPN